MELILIIVLIAIAILCFVVVISNIRKHGSITAWSEFQKSQKAALKDCAMCNKKIGELSKPYDLKDNQAICASCYKELKHVESLLPTNFMATLGEMNITTIKKELNEIEPICDYWWDNDIHHVDGQAERQSRSQQVRYPVLIDPENRIYEIQGASREPYRVSLLHCDCKDFAERGLPCKHMYRVAGDLGLF